jgi:predicted permease
MWRRRRSNDDFSNEIRANIEIEADRLIAGGMNEKDAYDAARRSFGNVTRVQERFYESNRVLWLDDLRRDAWHALRQMAKRPGFAAMAILTLALGIGANAAIFSLLDAVVLKPLPVPSSDELITLYERGTEGVADPAGGTGRYLRFSYPRFQRLAAALGSHGSLAAVTRSNAFVMRQSEAGGRARITGQLVSGGYFKTLQALAERGRLIDESDVHGAAAVAVISDNFWRRGLNSSEDAIGRPLVLNGLSVAIVGVAEQGFSGLWTDSEADVWLPLSLQQQIGYQNNSSTYGPHELESGPWVAEDRVAWLNVFGRVSRTELPTASVILQSANHEGVLDLASLLDPRDSMRAHTLIVERFARGFSGLRSRYSDALKALSILVGMVLLATCSSVATLLLSRAAGSAREIGIRAALGATTGRLVRQALTESVLLAGAGGAFGLLGGVWASRFLARQVMGNVNNLPRVFTADARVLSFTAVTALFTVLIFGLAPALRAMCIGREAAPGSNRRDAIDHSAMRGMRPLVAVQVALSVVIVFAALLLGRTLLNFTRIDPGFSDRLVAGTFDPLSSGYSADRLPALGQSLSSAVRAVPGVTSVVFTRCGLVANCSSSGSFRFEGSDGENTFNRNWVGPGYFDTVGISLVAGRDFDERDMSRAVAIVSESVARRYFPGQNPIGKRVAGHDKDSDTEIVGVARDARSLTVHNPPVPMIYLPLHAKSDTGMRGYYMEARVNGDPSLFVAAVRDAVRRAEPGLLVNDMTTMPGRLARDTTRERVVAYLSSSFALLTLLLASLGIYGVLSYDVARRTREIGVRAALGAQRSELTLLILGEGIGMTAAGIVVGLAGAAVLARYLQGMLFGVSALSFSSFVMVPLVFLTVAAAAAYLPARRAMRVDPMIALRYE